MVPPNAPTVRCATCGTEFASNDTAQLSAHVGHKLEHIKQA